MAKSGDETACISGVLPELPFLEIGCEQGADRKTSLKVHHKKNLVYIQKLIGKNKQAQEDQVLQESRKQKLRGQLAKRVLGESYDKIRPAILMASEPAFDLSEPVSSTADACTSSESSPSLAASNNRKTSSLVAKLGSSSSSPAMFRLPALDPTSTNNSEKHATGVRRRRRREAVLQSIQSDQTYVSRALQPGVASSSNDVQSPRRWGGPHPTARQQQEQYNASLQRQYGIGSDGYVQWRVKNRVPNRTRVFCMAGTGNHSFGIRAGLMARGWHENPDHNSPHFELKWACNPLDIDHDSLAPFQIVNHYSKASSITTKVGLCHTVRNLAWFEKADFLGFYPRAYDLSDKFERTAFVEDARQCAAEAVLKRALEDDDIGVKEPTVEVPILRLALHACLARLAAEKALIADDGTTSIGCDSDSNDDNCDGGGGAAKAGAVSGSGRAVAGDWRAEVVAASSKVILSTEEWDRLLNHKCITSGVPSLPAPSLDTSWLLTRRFITSAHGPSPMEAVPNDGNEVTGAVLLVDQIQKVVEEGADASVFNASVEDLEGAESTSMQEAKDVMEEEAVKESRDGSVSSRGEDRYESANKNLAGVKTGKEADAFPVRETRGEGEHAARLKQMRSMTSSNTTQSVSSGADSQGMMSVADATFNTTQPVSSGSPTKKGKGNKKACNVSIVHAAELVPERSDLEAADQVPDVSDAQLQRMDYRSLLSLGHQVLEALSTLHIQTHIDGMNNIWIVKPAALSRGRGIRLFNNLDKLFAYIKGEEVIPQDMIKWIAQKYVERPLIIRNRKFDIRQWVMVTDWNPLTVWFYKDCYLRFCADEYDPNNLDIFMHLSNNSIAKHYEGGKDDDITAGGNMWDVSAFKVWLGETFEDSSLWESLIQPAMKHIVVCTTKCAQEKIKSRHNSCQVYGFDFLIDDHLQVWLLEVNSSPTMEASTPVTTKLCAEVQEDMLKVVIDLPSGQQQGNKSSSGGQSQCDTGKFECIVGGFREVKTPPFMGLKLELQGKAMSLKGNGGAAAAASTSPQRPLVPACYTIFSQSQQAAAQAAAEERARQQQAAARRLARLGSSAIRSAVGFRVRNGTILPVAATAAPGIVMVGSDQPLPPHQNRNNSAFLNRLMRRSACVLETLPEQSYPAGRRRDEELEGEIQQSPSDSDLGFRGKSKEMLRNQGGWGGRPGHSKPGNVHSTSGALRSGSGDNVDQKLQHVTPFAQLLKVNTNKAVEAGVGWVGGGLRLSQCSETRGHTEECDSTTRSFCHATEDNQSVSNSQPWPTMRGSGLATSSLSLREAGNATSINWLQQQQQGTQEAGLALEEEDEEVLQYRQRSNSPTTPDGSDPSDINQQETSTMASLRGVGALSHHSLRQYKASGLDAEDRLQGPIVTSLGKLPDRPAAAPDAVSTTWQDLPGRAIATEGTLYMNQTDSSASESHISTAFGVTSSPAEDQSGGSVLSQICTATSIVPPSSPSVLGMRSGLPAASANIASGIRGTGLAPVVTAVASATAAVPSRTLPVDPSQPAIFYPKQSQDFPRLNISGSIFFNHGSAAVAAAAAAAAAAPLSHQVGDAASAAGRRRSDSISNSGSSGASTVHALLATMRLSQQQQGVVTETTAASASSSSSMLVSMSSSVYATTQARTSPAAKRLAILGASSAPTIARSSLRRTTVDSQQV